MLQKQLEQYKCSLKLAKSLNSFLPVHYNDLSSLLSAQQQKPCPLEEISMPKNKPED